MGKLTPSPSMTSTSFGCVVPCLDMGIVRPSRCVIVLSKPSNAYHQCPIKLMTFQSLPLHVRSSSIFLPNQEPPSLPTVIARHRITLARLPQLCSPFSPRLLSPDLPLLDQVINKQRLTSATLSTTLPTIPFSFLPQPPSPSFF